MKQVSTKKALIASMLSMLVCVSMLIGSTFAWFTDSASTNVNTIKSGNLDVALEMQDNDGEWVTAEGQTLQFKVNGEIPAEGTQILWEPGCTYELPALRVRNEGNLAVKYKIVVTGLDGDSELIEVIDWTMKLDEADLELDHDYKLLSGEVAILNISAHMQETAGNEYMDKELSGVSIKVVATQASEEYDSNGNTYDENADYPEITPVATISKLKEVLADAENTDPVAVKLYDNIDTDALNVADKEVSIDLNGKDLAVNNGLKVKNSTVVIKDSSEEGEGEITVDNSALYGVLRAENSDVTIESGNFTSTYANGTSGYARVLSVSDSNLTINGGYFENSDEIGSYNYMIDVNESGRTDETTITINGGEFVSHRSYGYFVTGGNDKWNTKVIINGGTFRAEGRYSNLANVKGTVEVNDCVYIAEKNNNVFGLPTDYSGTNSPKVIVRGGSYTVNDGNLSGFVYCNKSLANAYGYIPGTIILDPVTTLKINTQTHTTILSDCGVTQSAVDADGFYTITK